MRSLRFYIRLVLAFVTRFKALLLVSALLGIFVFFVIQYIVPKLVLPTTQRIGLAGRHDASTLPDFILDQISDGLTKINPEGIPEPALATSWESPDKGKTWIFHLNRDLKWQDGENIQSSDIAYEFSDLTSDRPDANTLVFTLDNAYTPFPSVVSKPVFKKGLLGVDVWEVKKVSQVGQYLSELVVKNGSSTIKYKFYPTEERLKTAFKLGEIDRAIKVYNPSSFDFWNTTLIEKNLEPNQVVAIFFNTSDSALSEKNLRQALTYAINKESFAGERALSPISPNSYFYNSQVKKYPYDHERAQEILKELPDEIKSKFPIKLVTTPLLLTAAESIAADWEKVGVPTQVQVTSVVPNDFQVYLTIFEIPKDPDQYSLWHSTQTATNISKYSNPRIDKILEDARSEINLEERKRLYLDFQRFLLEDLPAAFLYHPYQYTISRK